MRVRTTRQRVVERARILLVSAAGASGFAICDHLGVSRPTVTRWLNRYAAAGVDWLVAYRPSSGRAKRITPDAEAELVDATLNVAPPV